MASIAGRSLSVRLNRPLARIACSPLWNSVCSGKESLMKANVITRRPNYAWSALQRLIRNTIGHLSCSVEVSK